MKKNIILTAFSLFYSLGYTQTTPPRVEWSIHKGGSQYDHAASCRQTTDGGYIAAGRSYSNDGDLKDHHGPVTTDDAVIAKFTRHGETEWIYSYGDTNYNGFSSVVQTFDGGYIAVGYNYSNLPYFHPLALSFNLWIVKVRSDGVIEWEKKFGGNSYDIGVSLIQTRDSGYLVAGTTNSIDGDVHNNKGDDDIWIVKIDLKGTLQWEKTLGGFSKDSPMEMRQTSDGGYIIVARSNSTTDDVKGNKGGLDYWVLKLDSLANLQWEKSLGGSDEDYANSIDQTYDGGYIVGGYTSSHDGDVSFNHAKIYVDAWLVKLNPQGSIEWEKSLGGNYNDVIYCIRQCKDSGYIFVGRSDSYNGDLFLGDSLGRFPIVKLNPKGSIEWIKIIGMDTLYNPSSIELTQDGGYVIAGERVKTIENIVNYDFAIVKLAGTSSTVAPSSGENTLQISVSPNPFTDNCEIKTNHADNGKSARFLLFNVLGIVVKEIAITDSHSHTLSRDGLSAGMYYYLLQGENGIMARGNIIIE